MTREEAIAAAKHFRTITVKQHLQLADMLRRITKLEEGVSKDDIKKLDNWLKHHPMGDGYVDGKQVPLIDAHQWQQL